MSTQDLREPIRVGILALCPPPYGGVTRVVENHLRFWPSDAVEAYLIPNYPPAEPEPIEGAVYLDLLQDVRRSWKGASRYVDCLRHVPLTRPWVYTQFVAYNRALSRFIQDHGLDLLYAHHVWPAGASAVLQSRIHGIPAVAVAYGETWHTTPQDERQRRIEPYVLNGASWVVSTSEHCLSGAQRRGAQPERSSVIYAGIDLERFNPNLDGSAYRERLGIPPDAIVIATLGLALRKKLDTFLDAIEQMDANRNVYCLIGGAGDEEDYVRARAELMSGVNVRALGFVPESELPAFYAALDVLVVSPRTLLECMGQSMKEAMACGVAVVGAHIGGVPEAITDGVNGILFEPDDPAALRAALVDLCSDRARRRSLGVAGRRTAEEHFNARASAEETLDLFRRVLHERAELS